MMNIFVNTTIDAFLGSTIPDYAREHGNDFAARKCYATAVLLFQEDKIMPKEAIRMLDKVLELSPNFSDADQYRQEIWHRILRTRSMSPEYPNYLKSPAWLTKKAQVLERNGYRCALCNTEDDLEVHHKNYDNIGKEPLGDLIILCKVCHSRHHDTFRVNAQKVSIPADETYAAMQDALNTFTAPEQQLQEEPSTPPPLALEKSNDEEQDVPFYPSTPTELPEGVNQDALDRLNDILNQAREEEEETDSVKPTAYN